MSDEAPYLGKNNVSPHPPHVVILRMMWIAVQATLFRWSPRPFHGFRALLLRLFGADIPQPFKVVVFPTATIAFPSKLALAPHSVIGPRVRVYNLAPISLQRGATVSQDCHLCAGTHDYNRWSMPLVTCPIVIGENAWLAADVFVGPGVTVGELCVVGARSVVMKNLPPRMVCVGHPCQPIKPRSVPTSE
jgi:putative colanic acid biosynthesis acetyltransferase WcaF